MFDSINRPDERTARHHANGHHENGADFNDHLAPPSGAVLHPPTPHDPASRPWFLVQLWSESRLLIRMYFDPRYRVSRTAQLLLPLLLVLFALNYFAFSVWVAIPVLSAILERFVCVLLGVFLYKVMTRELARYCEVLDYLERYGGERSV